MNTTILTNGVTYYDLPESIIYPGDKNKNCALKAKEIDLNFNTLRGYDICSFDLEGNKLILKRLNGEDFIIDLNLTNPDTLKFEYDPSNGEITITYPDGEQTTVSGFTTSLYTDNTLKGNGTIINPLGLNNTEKTGVYAPADDYLDLTEGGELPSEPKIGDRIVTKVEETLPPPIGEFTGNLYQFTAIKPIKTYLSEIESEWHIPTKEEWDTLLNSFETEEHKNHDSDELNEFLGYSAGQILKSEQYWLYNDNAITEDGTCGFDEVDFNVLPCGYYLRSGNSYFIRRRNEEAYFWTSTEKTPDSQYIKYFSYNKNGVAQKLQESNQFYSIRLVKDYNDNFNPIENILGTDYTTKIFGNKVWMLTNLAVGEDVIPGLRKEDTSSRRKNYTISEPFEESPEKEIKFYINEWDGNEWIRKELVDGDSIIIRNYNQGIEDYYILWTIKNNDLCSISLDLTDYTTHAEMSAATVFAITSANTYTDEFSGNVINHINAELLEYTTKNKFIEHTANTEIHVTNQQKENWNLAYISAHTHANKEIIDNITSTDIDNWNSAYTLSKEAINGIVEGDESGVEVIENKLDFQKLFIDCGTW